MKVVLIPCATTEWLAEGRLLGRVELPFAPEAAAQCSAWVEQVRPVGLSRVFHSPDELATETAQRVAGPLNVPAKALDELTEVDVGLWAGLTEAQIRSRYASAYRELSESPLNVTPPDGESFSAAAGRVRACLRKRIKPDGKQTVALVLRPILFEIARCLLTGSEDVRVWDAAHAAPQPLVLGCERIRAGAAGRTWT